MYSIQKFVLEQIKEKGLKRAEFVRRAGYTNISKGCRRLDDFLNGDEFNPEFISRLKSALDDRSTKFEEQLRETKREIQCEIDEKEELISRSFVPYLYCQTEHNIPSPIFACAMIGADRMKRRDLHKDFASMPERERDRIRKKKIAEVLALYNGRIPTFGLIECFTQKLEYKDKVAEREVYDLKGNLVLNPDEKHKLITMGRATLTVNGKDITKLFNGLMKINPES
jgi:hypothetical protein